MKGFIALAIQDSRRLMKNSLFWVITATLIIIIALINFVLPGDVADKSHRIFSYNTDSAVLSTAVDSEAELRQAVREEGTVGLLGADDGSVTILHPGLSEKTVHAVMLLLYAPSDTEVDVERIYSGGRTIPFNERMTPVFICFEALVIGFILGGALMLSEKEEGTIHALRISPMGAHRYLISKTMLFSLIGALYALLMAIFCVGTGFSIVSFILLSFFGAAIFSLIGLAFSTLFKDMSSWFFSMALLLSVNMLPVVAYLEPSFSPLWMKAIPSYSIIFAYERILFGLSGNSLPVVLTVAGWCTGSYVLSSFVVGRYLLAEGRR
jgi:fluoroquinolone transport system permease protein